MLRHARQRGVPHAPRARGEVQDRLELDAERLPLRKEGINEGRWALLDYGELIVHVLMPDDRRYYDLESFWSHGESRVFLPSVKLLEKNP